jgi:1,4-dihydroxy-2-naphthoyl-CoA hydrolase
MCDRLRVMRIDPPVRPDPADLIAFMPFASRLGITLEEGDEDRVVATLAFAPDLCTSAGVLHGGVLMSLADTAGALVAFLGLAPGQTTATITSTTQMFRPVSDGVVRAVATFLHRGRTTAAVQTQLTDSEGRLVAQTTQIQVIRNQELPGLEDHGVPRWLQPDQPAVVDPAVDGTA